MAHKIQKKRGSKPDLPVLNDGEMGLCIDTQEVFVGSNGTNIPVSYAHPTTAGNKHIPTGGASGQILRYSASGTASWGADNDTITTVNGKTGAITKSDITALGIPAQDTVVDISGKADKTYVDNKVKTDVPVGAKFTDTMYSHPATHPASMITQTASDRFVTDSEKTNWNSKAPGYTYGTADLTAGSSSLATGTLYFVYE